MSSLSNQLKSIKLSQNALKIGANQEQPSILFDKYTARSTSIDTIYSMAILAYDKLQSNLSNSLEQVQSRQQLLSQSYKQINRNTLNKQENNVLSRKLQKFIIELAPYLLNSQCQQVFQYLFRNFKINVFQTQVLVLALLQYWNYQIYQKVIQNISKKQMTGKLTFLNQMVSTQQINFSFIIKTLTFSHAILDKLISIVLQGSLLQIKTGADHLIHIESSASSQNLLKHPLKNFLLKIFLTIIKEKRTNHYKYIIDFCSSCLRIKYPVSQKDQKFQLISGVLILLSNLLVDNGISEQYLQRTVQKLIKKFVTNQQNLNERLSQKSVQLIFNFIMLVWQRKSHLIDLETIQELSANQSFKKYLNNSQASKYMIFYHLWNSFCIQGSKCEALIQTIGINIKSEQFYKQHENNFLQFIFQAYQRSYNDTILNEKQRKWSKQFIKKNYKYQFGVYINESRTKGKIVSEQLINSIFNANQINIKTNCILIQSIQKTMPQKKLQSKVLLGIERMKIQQQKNESEMQQQNKEQGKQIKRGKKLMEILRSRGIEIQNEIDYQDQNVKTCLIELFGESYNKNELLSFHQKNLIIEKYGSQIVYSPEKFNKDLNSQQYSIAIKIFSSHQEKTQLLSNQIIAIELQYLQHLFTFIVNNRDQLQSILFKQLLRLSLNKLIEVSKCKYKQAITFLHKYYKKLTLTCKSLIDYVQINNLLLKISQKLFVAVGNNKGKYQNLIHSHCKILALLINNMDSHQFTSTSPVITHTLLLNTYHQIISIFGVKQLYLINTGIIELITRKQLNYQQLKFFIQSIMIKQLNYQLQSQKESQIGVNYYQHAISIGKSLIFASFMLGSGQSQWINSIAPILTSGIARNQVAIFYGLVKDKLKRNIVRKLFLFFKLTFESKRFAEGFKNYLSIIQPQQMRKLLHIYSQLYYVLLSINIGEDPKIQSVIQKLLDKITNLFSLDLRLNLFKPLLPNVKLYSYLNQQLKTHKQANFDQLSQLVNICPDQPSLQWVGFVNQCLKRGHLMSPQCAEAVFLNQHFLNNQQNFSSYCQLTCYLSEHSKDTLIPYINQCMNIILAVCQTDPNQDYCLSLLYKIIINMKQLVDPFVSHIYKYVLQSESQFVGKFIEDTVQGLTVPTLIQAVKVLSKTSKHLYNYGIFFKNVCKHGVGHLLSKTLQYYGSKIINSSIEDEVDLTNLYELGSDIFLQMTLKFNQNQLRKVLIDFIRWSQIKQNQQISIAFNMRKIFLSTIYSKLSSNLGNLFTPFYGYVFDSYLKDLDYIVSSSNDKSNKSNMKIQKSISNKRPRVQSNYSDQVTLTYLIKLLQSLTLLFQNDTQKQFLDSTKFDLLSQRLANLFIIDRLQYNQYRKLTQTLSNCLLNLCKYLTDDYQLKSLNLKILLLLRHKVARQQQAIFEFMDKLIDQIQDRYLLFINDLVPFLIDNVQNRNQKVKVPIKSIINKFQQMSGSKIQNYMR